MLNRLSHPGAPKKKFFFLIPVVVNHRGGVMAARGNDTLSEEKIRTQVLPILQGTVLTETAHQGCALTLHVQW